MRPIRTQLCAAACVGALASGGVFIAQPAMAAPAKIGYYDMSAGQGVSPQVAPIQTAGATPVQIFNLSAAELAGIDVLAVQNPDNSGFGGEYLANLANVRAAVNNGMELVVHDRHVAAAENILPGGAAFDVRRDFADYGNINVVDNRTLVTNGPGGLVDNTTLDGGSASSHGYTVGGTLPGDSVKILSRGNPDEIVNMCYRFGGGSVMYSSIPLDFYLASPNFHRGLSQIYAPNAMAYGAAGACSQQDVTPPELSLPGPITVNATGPNGAVVDYTASAVDAADPNPSLVCVPAPGATLPIGVTTVECTATDAAGNTITGTFTVSVKGAAEQLVDLDALIRSYNLPAATQDPLIAKVTGARNSLVLGRLHDACNRMADFTRRVNELTARNRLTADQATELLTDSARISAVIGCA